MCLLTIHYLSTNKFCRNETLLLFTFYIYILLLLAPIFFNIKGPQLMEWDDGSLKLESSVGIYLRSKLGASLSAANENCCY